MDRQASTGEEPVQNAFSMLQGNVLHKEMFLVGSCDLCCYSVL